MAVQKKGITTYKCDKNKTEISGDPEDVKDLIKYEQRAKMVRWLIIVAIIIIAMFVLPTENIIPILLKWFKQLVPLFLSG